MTLHAAAAPALLFDLDGTLIHSMPLHHASWRQWHAGLGLPFDDDGFFEATAGRTNAEILRDLYPAHSEAERERMAEQQKLEDTKTDVGWGHQIRSYVLDQSRIKDLRTNVEISNTQKVLDGDLDTFIEASLKEGL